MRADSGHILKTEPTGFPDGSKKREIKNNLAREIEKMEMLLSEMGKL